jgi:hypothetical protein
VYHRFQAVMPHDPRRKTMVADQTYVYFDPNWERYRTSKIRPQLSPEGGQSFARSVAAAQRTGLKVRAWVVALHYSPGFRAYPDYWPENVFGEKYPAALCLSNDDVQDYFASLASDLVTGYAVDEIELESAHWLRFFNPVPQLEDRVGIRLGPLDELALSLCFCPACAARAARHSVDVERLKHFLQAMLARTLESGEGRLGAADELLDAIQPECPELRAFLEVRFETVADMLRKIRQAAGRPVAALYYSWPAISGQDPAKLAASIDNLVLMAYSSRTSRVKEVVQEALNSLNDPGRWRVALSLFRDDLSSRTTLRRHVRVLSDLGINQFAFYNYGLASLGALEDMRGAIHGGSRRVR